MLRRSLFLFCLVPLFLSFLAFSCFAASYNFNIPYVDGEGYLSVVDSVPTSGSFNYIITASSLDIPGLVFTSSGSGVLVPLNIDHGVTYYTFSFTLDGTNTPLQLLFVSQDGLSIVGIASVEGNLDPGLVFDVSLSSIEFPAFEESTSNGLSSSISWVKSVTDSLISGDLVNLLAIGALSISISLLLLTAKLIRKFAWGS